MVARSLLIALVVTMWGPTGNSPAEEPTARVVPFHGYTQAVELKLGKTRAVLCPQAGGRVLEFSVEGTDAMYLEEAEKNWKPGKPGPITAGRFDYGPELTVTAHPKAWSGEWTAEITKTNSVKLTSPREDAGIQRVYNEAAGLTLSVWSPRGPQIELEPIGPRERLAPGESASFTEDWWLCRTRSRRKGNRST